VNPDDEYQAALAEQTRNPKAARRAENGHWMAPAINDQLVEFEFRKIYGVQAADKSTLSRAKTGETLISETSGRTLLASSEDGEDKDSQPLTWIGRIRRVFCECFGFVTDPEKVEQRKQKEDSYKVSIIIGRPMYSSYLSDLVVMIVLVLLAMTSFWDTAAPELSSRMSISLTIILTLAAYTSTRPPPIVKCPKLTFQDRYEVWSFFNVTVVSIMNLFSVSMCGGEHPEAPQYMKDMYNIHEEICDVGWCHSRAIDCHFMVIFLSSFTVGSAVMIRRVFRERMTLTPAVREADEDERKLKQKSKGMNSGRLSPTMSEDQQGKSLNSSYGKPGKLQATLIGQKVAPENSPGKASSTSKGPGAETAQILHPSWPGSDPSSPEWHG